MSIRLHIVYGYFHTTLAKLRSCNRNHMASKAKKILTIWLFLRKSVLTSALGDVHSLRSTPHPPTRLPCKLNQKVGEIPRSHNPRQRDVTSSHKSFLFQLISTLGWTRHSSVTKILDPLVFWVASPKGDEARLKFKY